MIRESKAVIEHVFTFERGEIDHLTLESEQYDYMEKTARENLRLSGMDYMGGSTEVRLNYEFSHSTITILI